jgi:LysM repeat protein
VRPVAREPEPDDWRPPREPTDPHGVRPDDYDDPYRPEPRREPTDPRGQRAARERTDPRGQRPMPGRSDPRGQPAVRGQTDPRGQQAVRGREHTDPRGQREAGEPPRMLPALPTLIIAGVVVLLAFILGRATAGGGNDISSVSSATVRVSTTTLPAVVKHTVQKGESLLAIASHYGVTADALAAANGITNQNHVFVGQVLTIPPTTSPGVVAVTTTTTRPKH